MCGILLVKAKQSLPVELHLKALSILKSRGPDHTRYRYVNNIFIAQTVLHITGTDTYYKKPSDDFLAYNGEIYNYKELGNYSNDIEFVDECVNRNARGLARGWGPWAWAWSNNEKVRYAADPQGEKTLYQYQDDDMLIVCSEVAPMLEYIKDIKVSVPYINKTWSIIEQTPYKGITRVIPGWEYTNGIVSQPIDMVWNWIKPDQCTYAEATEEFDMLWKQTIKTMTPACDSGLTYSGGLDSSLILNSIDDLKLYAINNTGKDPIVDNIDKFLTTQERERLTVQSVSKKQWHKEYVEMLYRTRMPAGSWSFVGQWIVSKMCKERVLFTGVGADELFGGYDLYQTLSFNDNSPYSSGSPLWEWCMDSYNNHTGQATLLADYWHQVSGVDCRAIDTIGGAFGIESRNPFIAKPIMQFALNLPFEYKVSTVSKPIIRDQFLKRWTEDLIYTKKGFTGHANDSFPSFKKTKDRMADWKTIAQESFYEGKHI